MNTQLLRKIYKVFFRKIERSFFFHGDRMSDQLNSESAQWKCYSYLKRDFAPFLSQLPRYEESSEECPHIIWWCWLQGEANAPDLCKICLTSVKRVFPDYNIRIVTYDNLNEYLAIPDYIMDKHRNGIIGGAHFSDIIRTMLLVKYGGVWVDSTVFCSGINTRILSAPFFVFQNWKFNQEYAAIASNWLIVSNKNHPILRTTLDLLMEYWKTNNYVIDYYLFHLLFHMAADQYPELWKRMPRYSNIPPHILQFELFEPYSQERFQEIMEMSSFHKLNRKATELKKETRNTFYDYIRDSFL